MRKMTLAFFLVPVFLWTALAHAALQFEADFAADQVYDRVWPLKTGQVVTVDIYVSDVPTPGLIAMGFKLVYDPQMLSVDGAGVDEINWPYPFGGGFVDMTNSGEILMAGFRLSGLSGGHIRLATVRLRCIGEGTSTLSLLDRDQDWFVLFSEAGDPIVLDDDIGSGVLLTEIRIPIRGDVTGDGAVDLADAILGLQTLAGTPQRYVHANADLNNDGCVGLAEVIEILRKLSGLR